MNTDQGPRPDPLADELERQADELRKYSEELMERVIKTRQDWERKRGDPKVPGAQPPDGDDDRPAERREPEKGAGKQRSPGPS
jgi:hypothetical protein